MKNQLFSEASPLVTYKLENEPERDTAPVVLGPTIRGRGGHPHNQAKNRAAKRARRINRLNRNGQHL